MEKAVSVTNENVWKFNSVYFEQSVKDVLEKDRIDCEL